MKLELPSRKAVSRTIACEPALAWDILTDYTAYPEWLPLVSGITQKAREANFALLDAELAPFPGRTVAIECAHAPVNRVLTKSMIGQDPEFILDWTIAEESPGQTVVTVKGTWVHTPSNFRNVFGALDPEAWLSGLAKQIGSFSMGTPTGPTDPDSILEIHETEAGLLCFYRGRKYEMKEVS